MLLEAPFPALLAQGAADVVPDSAILLRAGLDPAVPAAPDDADLPGLVGVDLIGPLPLLVQPEQGCDPIPVDLDPALVPPLTRAARKVSASIVSRISRVVLVSRPLLLVSITHPGEA